MLARNARMTMTMNDVEAENKKPLAVHERPPLIVCSFEPHRSRSPGWLWHRAFFDSPVAVALLAGQFPRAHS